MFVSIFIQSPAHRARRVEDLKHALLAVHLHLLPVAVLDGGVVLLHEDALDKLDGEGGLAYAPAAQHHDLVFPHAELVRWLKMCHDVNTKLFIIHEKYSVQSQILALRGLN